MSEESDRESLHAAVLNAKLCLDTALSGAADSPAGKVHEACDYLEIALEALDDE